MQNFKLYLARLVRERTRGVADLRSYPAVSFISLFDSSLSNESNNQELRKRFTLYHERDHHCKKFDETLFDFNKSLTQTITDVRKLLNSTCTFSKFGKKFHN